MCRNLHTSTLISKGLAVESLAAEGDMVLITARAVSAMAAGSSHPAFTASTSAGYQISLFWSRDSPSLVARRFRCEEPHWGRQILLNASMSMFFKAARVGRRGSIASFIALGLPSVGVPGRLCKKADAARE